MPNMTAFPDGMKAVADYVHSKGLKFGIYSSAGVKTCAGYPGSLGYETQDAQSYAEWGVDYVKYDNCYNTGIPAWNRYADMRLALNSTGRDIFYSICNWGNENVTEWGHLRSNSWRTTWDIQNTWQSMKGNFLQNQLNAKNAHPGGWNDPDMLIIGNGGLTVQE